MRTASFLIALAVIVLLTTSSHSQAPSGSKTAVQLLQEMKAANEKLLQQQAATLLKIEELEKEAQQIKVLASRS